MAEIFDSCFKLSFSQKDIESDYSRNKEKSVSSSLKIVSILIFILSCAASTSISFFYADYADLSFKVLMVISYFITFCYLIFLSLLFCMRKNIRFYKFLNNFNYSVLVFVSINFRYPLIHYLKVNNILFYALMTVETMFRLGFIVVNLITFLENFILNCITLFFIWVVYPPIGDPTTELTNMLLLLACSMDVLLVILFGYFLERQRKMAFYYSFTANRKAQWLLNILDNLNNGFISIKNKKIAYINSYMLNKIENYKSNYKDQVMDFNLNPLTTSEVNLMTARNTSQVISYDEDYTNVLIYSLLSNIQTDSIHDSSITININELNSEISNNSYNKKKYISLFIDHIVKYRGFSEFIFIGEKNLLSETDQSETFFEVYCRYNKVENGDEELEFLFNDVTRSKVIEKQKTEFKYRTLFLSKVAHEFKNPLICITELIKQLNFGVITVKRNLMTNNNIINSTFKKSSKIEDEFSKTLKQIKSMSEFLLILVRDLDYFAQIQIEKNISLDSKEVKIQELVNFLKDITNSLLTKNNKFEDIKFVEYIHENVIDRIITDEWRLKQILINLLSNAVKFTIYGEVRLEISMDEREEGSFIRFQVSDTGMGIKNPENLFKPYSKGISASNENGAGLGLSIVQELTSKLGEKIQFITKPQEGTCFWFSIPVVEGKSKSGKKTTSKYSKNEKDNNTENNILISEDLAHSHPAHDSFEHSDCEITKEADFNIKFRDHNHSSFTSSLDILPKNTYSCKNLRFKDKYNIDPITYSPANSKFRKNQIDVFSIVDIINPEIINSIKNSRPGRYNTERVLNILIADDEKLTRQSTIRILSEVCIAENITMNIIEAEDGIECIYAFYKCLKKGIKIHLIFSDETMNFMNGIKTAQNLRDITKEKNLQLAPFYLVTAYDDAFINLKSDILSGSLTKFLSKPLNREDILTILNEQKENF